jgi:glyoxylase-like metal-dependent hydrolase (beta-lactamase superfamily II)
VVSAGGAFLSLPSFGNDSVRFPRFATLAFLLASAGAFLLAPRTHAQAGDRFADVEITAQSVVEGVYMLRGAGGNLGLYAGGPESKGPFLIDDQYAPLTPRIRAAIGEITDRPVRFLLNTHWHPDHTGGNENFGEAGALLVAHENVRERLSKSDFHVLFEQEIPAAAVGALPVVTFTERMSFHLGMGDGTADNATRLRVEHQPHAHTDGDAVVFFEGAERGTENGTVQTVHMGDLYFAGGYPLIDIATGGSIDGVIDGIGRVLDQIDAGTPVIPGHGSLSDGAELRACRDMLVAVRERVQTMINEGQSLEDVLAAAPTEGYDAEYDAHRSPEAFVTVLYRDLTGGIEQRRQRRP